MNLFYYPAACSLADHIALIEAGGVVGCPRSKGSAETQGSDAGEGLPHLLAADIQPKRCRCWGRWLEILTKGAISHIWSVNSDNLSNMDN